MKLMRHALVATVAALAIVGSTALPAQAASTWFDVTKLSAKDIVVSDWNCVNTDVDIETKKSKVDDWFADVEVSSKKGYETSAYFGTGESTTKDRVQVCPGLSGLGKYTLGPSEVSAYYYGNEADDYDYGQVERADYTKGSFNVRGKATASVSAKRKGSYVTLNATTKRYDPDSFGKVSYNPKVKFQVKSGSKWKTLKTVTAKKGKSSYKVKSKGKKTYRIAFDQVSWATGAASKSVKK